LTRCFAADEVEEHGQRFLFLPRPERPPVFVGGAPPHALARAVRYGDGWMPMGGDPQKLGPAIRELQSRAADAGRGPMEVVLLTALPLADPAAAALQLEALREVGVTRIATGSRYDHAGTFATAAERLAEAGSRLGA